MINLELKNFIDNHSSLNGNRKIKAGRLDLLRSMITLGYDRTFAAYSPKRIYRMLEFIGIVYDSVEISKKGFRLTDSFLERTQSDKVTTSYQIGMGLTKLVSEKIFNIPWLMHLRQIKNVQLSPILSPIDIKFTLHSDAMDIPSKEPDLIGFGRNKEVFVFESKGYSSGYNKYQHQHAINQVSQVSSVNGIAPEIRCACFFDLSRHPFKGHIIDPVNDKGISIKFEDESFFNNYYMIFTDEYFTENSDILPFLNRNFRFMFLNPEFLIGIDEIILKGLEKNPYIWKSEEYLDFSKFHEKNQKKISERYQNISLGQDGIILIKASDVSISRSKKNSDYQFDVNVSFNKKKRGTAKKINFGKIK